MVALNCALVTATQKQRGVDLTKPDDEGEDDDEGQEASGSTQPMELDKVKSE